MEETQMHLIPNPHNTMLWIQQNDLEEHTQQQYNEQKYIGFRKHKGAGCCLYIKIQNAFKIKLLFEKGKTMSEKSRTNIEIDLKTKVIFVPQEIQEG